MTSAERYRTIVCDPPWPYEVGMRSWAGEKRWTNPTLPYDTMPVSEIAALPVGAVSVPDAHLYLWTTQRFIWDAKAVAERWGFTVERVLTWCKQPMGKTSGGAFCNSSEFFLFCRRDLGPILKAARIAKGLSTKELCGLLGAYGSVNHGGSVANWEAGRTFPPLKYGEPLNRILGADFSQMAGPPQPHDSTWFTWARGRHSEKPEAFFDLVEQISPSPYLELFARRRRLGWSVWGNEVASDVDLEATA